MVRSVLRERQVIEHGDFGYGGSAQVNGHVLLLTGGAPYLGGPHTWKPLRDAAPEIEFRDLDVLDVPAGGDFIDSLKSAIGNAARGASAVVAHGTVASIALEAMADAQISVPVMLLSPVAVTKDSRVFRLLRAALAGPMGGLLTSAARSKRKKLMNGGAYLRRQMELLVRSDKISDALFEEARDRVSDPRMDPFIERTADTLRLLLTPTGALERSNATCLFGNGRIDRKVRKRIAGTVVEAARSAPMLETPEVVAQHIRELRRA